MEEIIVPRINANDNIYVVRTYFVAEGKWVNKNDKIAAVSSSKSVVEMLAEGEGYIHFLKKEQEEIKVGEVMAVLFKDAAEKSTWTEKADSGGALAADFTLTKLARELADEHHLTQDELRQLNKKLIKKTDIELYLHHRKAAANEYMPLSFNQIEVGKAVTKSAREVPKAFQVSKIKANKLVKKTEQLTEEFGVIIGLGELLAVALKESFTDFKKFYGTWQDDGQLLISGHPGIGVTYDMGNGLFIPVVKEEDAASVERVSEVMLEYKINAMRGEFSPQQLAGGAISISITAAEDVVFVSPIIPPGQICILSAGSIISSPAFDQEGQIGQDSYFYLGIAYDHRVINGYEATNFITHIKNKLEQLDLRIYQHNTKEEENNDRKNPGT